MAADGADLAAGPQGVDTSGLRCGEALARHTSMRVGGPADFFCSVDSEAALAAWLGWAREKELPVFLLGGGTNLVVGDAGIRGLTLKLGRSFAASEWKVEGDEARVVVGAAANFKRFVSETIQRGFAGLEFAEGIPGTVGGAVIMNAGAFGGEIGDTVDAIRGVSASGEIVRLPRAELDFAYRRLALPAGCVVTSLEVRLRRGDSKKMTELAAVARGKRGKRQPRGYPNAGSIWKNPKGDYAGRLIDTAGLRGESVGGARISEEHANFIVNVGDARAADVRALMEHTRERVWATHGVWLEAEVKLVGEWSKP